ncbi:hypothetical protein EDD86DRAFT_12770 [Gorgonomyces haynaldii]|nr:hypothetical protein EDD86DRAFT_12770 [Gorgonomyces haynaldii]
MVKCLMIGQEHGMVAIVKQGEISTLTSCKSIANSTRTQSNSSIKSDNRYLKDTFSLHDEEKAPILLDLYWYTLGHAKRLQLGPEQTSAFFSIVKTIHENCVGIEDDTSIAIGQFRQRLRPL